VFVVDPRNVPPIDKPLGVLQAFVAGYEAVAAKPVFILPLILMDLLLWLGPRIGIPDVIRGISDRITAVGTLETQLVVDLQQVFDTLANNFNLLAGTSAFPIGSPSLLRAIPSGLPSVIAGRLPSASPLGQPWIAAISNSGAILGILVVGLVVWQAVGVLYHRWLAQDVIGIENPAPFLKSGLSMIALSLGLYVAGLVGAVVVLTLASIVWYMIPLVGLSIGFLGFSLAFWGLVYSIFAPHFIVRDGINPIQAIMRSIRLVRWNFLDTVGFFIILFGANWALHEVWVLPADKSWLTGLAIAGHALTTTILLMSSYQFFQNRWVVTEQAMQRWADLKANENENIDGEVYLSEGEE
jgi:hypothetical protein